MARTEVEHIANLMEAEPMGLQFGLLAGGEPSGQFQILRSRDRAMLAINPFRSDTIPHLQSGGRDDDRGRRGGDGASARGRGDVARGDQGVGGGA